MPVTAIFIWSAKLYSNNKLLLWDRLDFKVPTNSLQQFVIICFL